MLKVEKLRAGNLPPLSFEVAAGECLAIEGPSGSGKTRLLRALADLDPAQGYVLLEGLERAEMTAPRWRRQIRFVPAEPGWWADLTAEHFPDPPTPRMLRLLASLGLDATVLARPVATLSTGERQRLGLIRALLDEPQVLLLDEPTAALDGEAAALVEELIRFQLLSRRAVILVSHDAGQIARLAHQRLLLAPPRETIPDAAAGRGDAAA